MVRLGAEQGYMAWATFYNEGERYGAPTDPTTNPPNNGTTRLKPVTRAAARPRRPAPSGS